MRRKTRQFCLGARPALPENDTVSKDAEIGLHDMRRALRKPFDFVSYDGVTVPARRFDQTQFVPFNPFAREEAAF
jgi:hypothetical protein